MFTINLFKNMKYKRQLMGSLFALSLLVGNYSNFDTEDFIPTSKVGLYVNQVKMKSSGDEWDVNVGSEEATA